MAAMTTKRGLAAPPVHSALAMTRRWRLQLSRVAVREAERQRNRRTGHRLPIQLVTEALLSDTVRNQDREPGGWWWNAPSKIRFARDSPLEGSGFELSVPHDTIKVSRPPRVASSLISGNEK
jgi:hypothetical protein